MDRSLFGSELWKPALDKYAEATGLTVQLFGADGRVVLESEHLAPLVALFREHGYDPGLFTECAGRCVRQPVDRPVVAVAEAEGLLVVGTSLVLEGAVVGAAVAGYALVSFFKEATLRHWAKSVGLPFDRLWLITRQQAPQPERRLKLHGELLQVLGDALLRENHRTRQYEDAIEKLKAAAAAKDEFLAVLSHELRTPLAPIAGWASVLKSAQNLQRVQQAADAIERNTFLQSRMIDDLLDVTRIVHGTIVVEHEVLELSACVRAALEALGPDIEKKAIHLEVADASGLLFVKGDAVRLQQVFRNILSNAVKFTPSGGSIRVALGRDASAAHIVVADTGRGIAPEFLPSAFELFRQQESGTRREYAGLGIGLALVKKLTALQGGTVTLSSAGEGRGTEVAVHFPLVGAALDPGATAAADLREPASLAGISMLVIDDVQDAREILQILLQHLGAQVAIAAGGREALEIIPGLRPDLVLCDLRMPQMDGFEFIEQLQRANPGRPPVVAVSALASDLDRQRIREAGFEAYLKKPYDGEALVAAVGHALSRRLH